MNKVFVGGVVFVMFYSTAFATVSVRGTVERIDSTAKTIMVTAPDGTEETIRLTDHAGEDAGKQISEGAEKCSKENLGVGTRGHKVHPQKGGVAPI